MEPVALRGIALALLLFTAALFGCAPSTRGTTQAPIDPHTSTLTKNAQVATVDGTSAEAELDRAVQRLADGITASVISKERKRVAVVPFARSDGRPPELGFYLADKLVNRLFRSTAGFAVVDRFHLDDAVKEIEMGYTGAQESQSAQKLGRILGADALVTGTLTKLDASIDVTLRLVATETMDVLATADGRIPRSSTVDRLWDESRAGIPSAASSQGPPPATSPPNSIPAEGGYVFYEDYRAVPLGELPVGWTGGENMAVKKAASGARCLAFFRSAPPQAYVQTPEIAFPENFDFELNLTFIEPRGQAVLPLSLGGLRMRLINTHGYSGGTSAIEINGTPVSVQVPRGVWFCFRVQRTGSVYTFLLDNAEIHVARLPGLEMNNIRFANQNYALGKITVKQLSDTQSR